MRAGLDVVRGAALSVAAGEFVSLLGTNGAGKTSLTEAVVALLPAARGSAIFEGPTGPVDLLRSLPWAVVRNGIAYVPQENPVFRELTVREYLQLNADALGLGPCRQVFDELFEMFPQLADRQRQLGGTLSGGEQRILALTRVVLLKKAIAGLNPKWVPLAILDEPSHGLAPLMIDKVLAQIEILRKLGVTFLCSEQQMAFARNIAGRGYLMRSGQILCELSASDLQSRNVERMYFGLST